MCRLQERSQAGKRKTLHRKYSYMLWFYYNLSFTTSHANPSINQAHRHICNNPFLHSNTSCPKRMHPGHEE